MYSESLATDRVLKRSWSRHAREDLRREGIERQTIETSWDQQYSALRWQCSRHFKERRVSAPTAHVPEPKKPAKDDLTIARFDVTAIAVRDSRPSYGRRTCMRTGFMCHIRWPADFMTLKSLFSNKGTDDLNSTCQFTPAKSRLPYDH